MESTQKIGFLTTIRKMGGMRRTFMLSLLFILTIGILSACACDSPEDGEHPLIGRWISDVNDFQYDFHAYGTGIRGVRPETESFTWRKRTVI